MDGSSFEPSGAVPYLKKSQKEDTPRLPLGPSEKNNAAATVRKPRTREIASRYKSGIMATPNPTAVAPRRCPSPSSRCSSPTPGASLPKRAVSAERRRPSSPLLRSSAPSTPSCRPSTPSSPSSRPCTPVSHAVSETRSASRRLPTGKNPDGLWPSMRSLSTSFQSEPFPIPVTKKERGSSPVKSPANATERKRTPLRGRNTVDQFENSKPVETSHKTTRAVDKKLWPGLMGGRVSSNTLSRSVDLTDKIARSSSLPTPSRGVSPKRVPISDNVGRGLQQSPSEVATGKVERDMGHRLDASSQLSERVFAVTRPSRTQSSLVPGLHRLPSPSRTQSSLVPGLHRPPSPSRTQSSLVPGLHRPPSPSRTQSSLAPGLHRPSSPSRTLSAPSSTPRGIQSLTRARPLTAFSSSTSTTGAATSVHNYIIDEKKGKKTAAHVDDFHQLRLLYNKDLQWRFVNARSEDALSIQKTRTENILHSVWTTTTELRDSVALKQIDVQHLRHEMKLQTILEEQMSYLEECAALDREYCSSLSGATEALLASTVRLPVTGGARVDIHSVKNAISSAVDVMQAMGSSICYLLSKVNSTKTVVSELSAVAAKERVLLDECRELLASVAGMQVQDSSLRTHLIQLRQGAHKIV